MNLCVAKWRSPRTAPCCRRYRCGGYSGFGHSVTQHIHKPQLTGSTRPAQSCCILHAQIVHRASQVRCSRWAVQQPAINHAQLRTVSCDLRSFGVPRPPRGLYHLIAPPTRAPTLLLVPLTRMPPPTRAPPHRADGVEYDSATWPGARTADGEARIAPPAAPPSSPP